MFRCVRAEQYVASCQVLHTIRTLLLVATTHPVFAEDITSSTAGKGNDHIIGLNTWVAGTFKAWGGDGGGFGLNTWVAIVAAVLSGLSIITIAVVFISQRKCCKQKKEDPESTVLKKRLQLEQKKMATYKCKLPFIEHPSCTTALQQEDNDIADEVKEIYSKISTDNSKPIICCPEKRAFGFYDQASASAACDGDAANKLKLSDRKMMISKVINSIKSNLSDQDNVDAVSVHEMASEALQMIANSEALQMAANSEHDRHSAVVKCSEIHYEEEMEEFDYQEQCNEFENGEEQCNKFSYEENVLQLVDSIENGQKMMEKLKNGQIGENLEKCEIEQIKSCSKSLQQVKSASRNLFTESEIHNTADIKSLFFEKWMKQVGEKPDEMSEESFHRDVSISYDDVESVLTSISRMDTSRIKKLKNTRFYKKIVSGMQPIKSESDSKDMEMLNDEGDLSDTEDGNNVEMIDPLHLTQEDLNDIVATDDRIIHVDSQNIRQPKAVRRMAAELKKEVIVIKRKRKSKDKNADDEEEYHNRQKESNTASESLFKTTPRTPNFSHQNKKSALVRRSLSCSDISQSSVEKTAKHCREENEGDNLVKSKTYGKSEKDISSATQSCQLTNWSQTINCDDSQTRRPHVEKVEQSNEKTYKSICDSEDARRSKAREGRKWCESESLYSRKTTTSSSCSCNTKTTTWEEIALKEKEKHKQTYHKKLENGVARGKRKESEKEMKLKGNEVFYVISNNNCFLLNERDGYDESDITASTYYLNAARNNTEYSKARKTT